jgi:hypothetical protein
MSDTDWARKRIADKQENLTAAEGENTLDHTAIHHAECAVITHIAAYDIDTNITRIEFFLEDDDGTQYLIHSVDPAAANEIVQWTGKLVLESLDHIAVVFTGCVLNDDIHSVILGYNVPQFKSATPKR